MKKLVILIATFPGAANEWAVGLKWGQPGVGSQSRLTPGTTGEGRSGDRALAFRITRLRRRVHTARKRPPEFIGWAGAPDRRPLRGSLLRTPERAPSRGAPVDHDQGRRLGADSCRRRRLQAAQLDDAADRDRGVARARSWSASAPGATEDRLEIAIAEVLSDVTHEMGRRTRTRRSPRTASRRTSRSCWPSDPPGVARDCGWCAASGRPTSARST